MKLSQTPIPEFEQEMSTTRRLLERVPSDKSEWKPHPKSFALGHLAQLVAWMPGWIANAAGELELDLAKAPGYTFEKTEALVAKFDENVANAVAALNGMKETDLDGAWKLTRGGMTLWEVPRREVLRSHLNHLCHHRGQLTVYLRLVDVPLPPIYGPTADERGM
ncbi:MAG: DinB family protein [Gemmatimonadaceae bacterium]